MDYSKIAEILSKHRVIGAGESTHGTHEFFEFKKELFKKLVTSHGFNYLFFEAPDSHCEKINQYIKAGSGNLEELVGKLFYFYRTREIFELFKWLNSVYESSPVELIGLDEIKYGKEYAKKYDTDVANLRDKRMATIIRSQLKPNSKGFVWAHNSHVAADIKVPGTTKEHQIPMGVHLRKWFKKDYYSLSLLFGTGSFSAARINDDGTSVNSNLVENIITTVPDRFLESELLESFKTPAFIQGKVFAQNIEDKTTYKVHNFGWGVKKSDLSYGTEWDVSSSFDGLVFFPKAEANIKNLIKS